MPLILAIDTSTTEGSVALVQDGRLLAEAASGPVAGHAQWLMDAVDGVLKTASRGIKEVSFFAMTTGPGSFTGLRIGISTVKGLAWALNKRVAAVSSLEALALNFRCSSLPVCPMLDARKGEVYAALYRFSGAAMPEEVIKDSALAPERLFEEIKKVSQGPVVFAGDGLKSYLKKVVSGFDGAVIAPEPLWRVKASNIARLAVEKGVECVEPARIRPFYLRKSEAELLKAPKPS